MQGQGSTLTHVELPHEASHVAVLEVLGQHLLGKLALVQHVEAVPALPGDMGVTMASPCRGCTPTLGWVSFHLGSHIPAGGLPGHISALRALP